MIGNGYINLRFTESFDSWLSRARCGEHYRMQRPVNALFVLSAWLDLKTAYALSTI